jgi:hypothetical protein
LNKGDTFHRWKTWGALHDIKQLKIRSPPIMSE